MKSYPIPSLILALLLPLQASAQGLDPTIRAGATEQVTDHVYMIPDESKPIIPNVGFVVGDRATLVIDTGLGQKNGKTVLAEARKLSATNKLYVACTHTHPEHDLGAMAFPDDAVIVRSSMQEKDIEEGGMGLANRFATFSEKSAAYLEGAVIRPSDVIFVKDLTLDLGGVHVQLIQAGPTHTGGDVVFWVEEDEVLFTGDVVMHEFPMPLNPTTTINYWLSVLDMLEALNPKTVIPSHYPIGSVELIQNYQKYFKTVQSRAIELADEGKSEEEAAETLKEEMAKMFSKWKDPNRIPRSVTVAFRDHN